MKANLFLIGAPKTGSTSLYHYLADHPDIFMCKDKEPHYFCTDFHNQCIKHHGQLIKFNYTSMNQYESLFTHADNCAIVGEASTSYLYSSSAAENIFNYNPDAKVIAILRNPVHLMNSWYHYINYTSEEPASSFQDALNLEQARKRDFSSIPKSVWYPSRVFYRELVQFDRQLRRYYDIFDHENIKVVLTEDLNEHPMEIYNEILSFLNINPHKPDFNTHNIYQEIRFKKLKWFIDNHLSRLKSYVRDNRGTRFATITEYLYKNTMGRDAKRPTIDASIQKELMIELLPMIQRTEKLLNYDLLNKWGLS